MNSIIQFITNNLQLVLVLLMVGGGILSAVSKALREQAATRKRRADMQRAQAEALRTGRPDPAQSAERPPSGVQAPPGASAEDAARRQRLAELAEARKRQIEELRRRALEQAGAGTATPSSTATPAPPTVRQPAPSSVRAPVPTGRSSVPRPASPTPQGSKARAPRDGPRPAFPTQATPNRAEQRNTLAEDNPLVPLPEPVERTPMVLSAASLREAVILTELLGPPVTMRERPLDLEPENVR